MYKRTMWKGTKYVTIERKINWTELGSFPTSTEVFIP